MKRHSSFVAVSLMLTALAPLQTRAADNTWNNGSANFTWDTTSANWTSPTIWADGGDALFGATGVGLVLLNGPITVHNQTFNAAGYTIDNSGNPLTLAGTAPTITVNADATMAASLQGTNGLTVQGTGVLTLASPTANQYTGGTYVRSGTLILAALNTDAVGTSYAVDSIEALDAGATVKLGSTFDGTTWSGAAQGQIATRSTDFASHLHMTGGTFDLNNDPKNQTIPVPDGAGLIINNGSSVQSGLNVVMDGLDHTFSGVIADGNNGVLIGDNSGQGPGYQIGIVSISGTAGSSWTLAGDNTYSGSTRIDGGTIVKLAGNHSLGIPTTNSLTGPLRIQGGSALDLNGRNQTIALMTDGGGINAKIYNSAVGTVATLTVGYGNEQANRNIGYQLMDNTGVGGKFALRKIITAPFLQGATLVTNCTQGLKDICVATYSGDTTVEGGTLNVQGPSAISPNSAYRLSTSNYANLWLNYVGDAPCRQLWINGVQQPNGTYGAGTPGIDPTSTGTITVTGFAPAALGVTQSGANLNFSWSGVYQLQSSTNNVLGPYSTYVGGGSNAATVPINPNVGAVYFRLATY
jgi:autotransporter-associated beta strand protein